MICPIFRGQQHPRSALMPTECNSDRFSFAPVEGRRVEAAFDDDVITSDAGALLDDRRLDD
jgi:hypothetical protein